MQKHLRIVGLIGALSLSGNLYANDTSYKDALVNLNKLLKANDFAAAYQYADRLTYDFGGEPEFDLLAGFAAYGNERYQEAVFAFERVLIAKPGSFTARYYLALSYQKVDNLHAAITELEKLQQRPITQAQRDKTDALLRRVNRTLTDRKIDWYQMLVGSLAYDSNVNTGTSASTLNLPGQEPIPLSDESRETRDMSYGLSYLAGYQHPITQAKWFKFDVSLNHNGYIDRDRYNRQLIGLSVAYEQELLRGQVSVAGFTRPLWLEQDVDVTSTIDPNDPTSAPVTLTEREIGLYRTESGTSFFFQKNTSRKTSYRFGGSYSLITNDQSPELDFTRIKGSGAFQYKTKLLHTIIGHYSQDQADDSAFDYNSKDTYGVTYQLTWPISNTMVSNTSVMLEKQAFHRTHALFQVKRDETLTALSSQLLFNSSEHLQLKLQLSYQNKDSNIDLFNYDRLEVLGSWQYRF